MHNSNIPENMELPSTKSLIKSTIIAAVSAGVLLVTVVMPAEYGIDPTGIGKALGLQKMGKIKISLAAEVAAEEAQKQVDVAAKVEENKVKIVAKSDKTEVIEKNSVLNHEMQVTLTPNEGTEIKAAMLKGAKINYVWWTDGGKANYDIHGDSKTLNIDYHNYEKGSTQRAEGTLKAAFDGSHGWFWRNRTGKTITVTLQTRGEYTAIKEMK